MTHRSVDRASGSATGLPPAPDTVADRRDRLADRYERDGRLDLTGLLHDRDAGRLALVSSFGTESAALLHLALAARPDLDVVHIDTGRHFPETLRYRDALREHLGFRLVVVRPDERALQQRDPDATLAARDADACCALRKTVPLREALRDYSGWLTGRKRMHGGVRAVLPHLERDGAHLKVNPLAAWDRADVAAYFERHALPRHPLEGRGYASIGCAPCTAPTAFGASARSGRWAGSAKTECGIHWGADGRPAAARAA